MHTNRSRRCLSLSIFATGNPSDTLYPPFVAVSVGDWMFGEWLSEELPAEIRMESLQRCRPYVNSSTDSHAAAPSPVKWMMGE